MTGRGELFDKDVPYAEAVARIAAHPAEWEPGTKAGYHPTSGWKILGAIVEAVDGRPIDRYVADEVLAPAGMKESRLGDAASKSRPPSATASCPSPGRATPWPFRTTAACGWSRTTSRRSTIEPWHVAKVEPGGGMRGPARELGRFYESLLGFGPPILEPRTVEVMGAVHRYGLPDVIFGGQKTPWGLGVQVAGGMSGGPGRRAFGHGGMASSRGLADPDAGLVLVLVANGLPDPFRNEQRMFAFTDGVYRAFGDELAHLRLPARSVSEAFQPRPDRRPAPARRFLPKVSMVRLARPARCRAAGWLRRARIPYRDVRASCDPAHRTLAASQMRVPQDRPQPVRAARPRR